MEHATYYGYDREVMQAIFRPRSIALIGASPREGALGNTLLWNLTHCNFKGELFLVNPRHESIGERTCYKQVTDIGKNVDLALIATPAGAASEVVRDCIAAGIRGAIVFSRDFFEGDLKGTAYRLRLIEEARKSNFRLLGPNSIGFMAPNFGLNASVRTRMPMLGNVGFISQSGALGASMLDMSFREKIGFSAFISVGLLDDLDWGDLIHFLGNDPDTHTIILHMESIRNPRRFISAAREVSYRKPIIAIRSGTTNIDQQITNAQGKVTSDDAVFDAMFRRSGVLRVRSIAELFSVAGVFSKQPRPKGKRLGIVTNSGGLATLAADDLLKGNGQLARLSEQTKERLNAVLREGWQQGGLIDLQNQAMPEEFEEATAALLEDPQNDGVLVVFAPQAIVNATQIAGKLKNYAKTRNKPLLTCFLGGRELAAANEILNKAQIPTLPYPDTSGRVFNYMWQYQYNQKAIYQTPRMAQDEGLGIPEQSEIELYLDELRQQYVEKLDTESIEKLFRTYQIPSFSPVPTQADLEELHFEYQIGACIDEQFGAVVYAGYGGALGDVLGDLAFGLPPLNSNLVLRMLEQTQIFRAMVKTHLRSEVIDEMEEIIVRIGRLMAEQPWVKSIHLPSVWVSPEGVAYSRAEVRLHPPEVSQADLVPLAIRPYPIEYEKYWKTRDDQQVLIRPIRPEDEPLFVKFHESLSNQSVYFRYFHSMSFNQRVSHDRLARLCFIDYEQDMALVVERRDEKSGEKIILGAGRLRRISGTRDGEYAIIVRDDLQRSGLGTELLRRLLDIGRKEGLARLVADILPENQGMRRVSEKLGFKIRYEIDEGVLKAIYDYEKAAAE